MNSILNDKTPNDKMILGKDVCFSTDSRETGLNNNVIVCGSSGCGKTMSISEPRFLETFHSSLIATVTKRRLVDKYKPVFEQRGYAVQDLNFIQPAKSEVAYDPLKYVRSYSDITFLAESIIRSRDQKNDIKKDRYWEEAAISLLAAEIAYVLMSTENASFADVLKFHDELNFKEKGSDGFTTAHDEKFERLAAEDPGCFACSCWRTFRDVPFRTAGCILSVMNATIDTLFSPDLRKLMAKEKQVDFEQLASRKTVLFVSTSAVNQALHCFVNIFYGQVFKTLFEYAESLPSGRLPIPVHVLCDDFATGSKILNFPEYISIFREKEISVTLLLQSESQLESIYGHNDATTIINNCDTYLYMGGMDLKTGHSVSQRLNSPLDEVLYMPIGQEYIFRRGQRPIITNRYDITKNEQYIEITKQYEQRIAKKNREVRLVS